MIPRVLMEANQLVRENQVVVIRGRVSVKEEEEPKLIADEVKSADAAGAPTIKAEDREQKGVAGGLYLRVPSKTSEEYRQVENLLTIFEGDWPVYIRFADTQKMTRAPSSMWTIAGNETMLKEMVRVLGEENVAVR